MQYDPQRAVYVRTSVLYLQPFLFSFVVLIYLSVVPPPCTLEKGPPGSPPGGRWENETYIGPHTIVVAMLTLGLGLLCPHDQRKVYVDPQGQRWYEKMSLFQTDF